MLDNLVSRSLDQVIIYLTIGFLFSLILTALSMPFVNLIGIKFNVIDKPNKRKEHKKNIVRLGGLGILFGFIVGIILLSFIRYLNSDHLINMNSLIVIIISSLLFYCLGSSDDIYQLKPLFKLSLQIIFASLIYSLGLNFNAVDISWIFYNIEPIQIPKIISFLFSILWIVAITNSMNWLDGLDGLASGISIIISFGILILFLDSNNIDMAFIMACFCGASLGFLRFNFYPAKILMGDGGSYLLGSSLAIISLIGLTYEYQLPNSSEYLQVLPIPILFLIFLHPIVDLSYVIFARIAEGYSPFYPDRRHIHHKILKTGMFHRDTVIILYGFTQLIVSLSLYISDVPGKVLYLCLSITFSILSILYCFNMKSQIDYNYKR